jgi:hypothetical protein
MMRGIADEFNNHPDRATPSDEEETTKTWAPNLSNHEGQQAAEEETKEGEGEGDGEYSIIVVVIVFGLHSIMGA